MQPFGGVFVLYILILCVEILATVDSLTLMKSMYTKWIPPTIYFTSNFSNVGTNLQNHSGLVHIPSSLVQKDLGWDNCFAPENFYRKTSQAIILHQIMEYNGISVRNVCASRHNGIGTWYKAGFDSFVEYKIYRRGHLAWPSSWFKLNRIPGSDLLTNKEMLWNNMKEYGLKEFEVGIIDTFILPEALEELKHAWNESKIWIAKPSGGSLGKEVQIIWDWADALGLTMNTGNTIIQKYISNPFLIQGKKLELRILVLVTSVEPLRLYVTYEGKSFFPLGNYTIPSETTDRDTHCGQIRAPKSSCPNISDHGILWEQTSTILHEHFTPSTVKRMKQQMEKAVINTLLSVNKKLIDAQRSSISNSSASYNIYQLFSFDFLVDDKNKLWLLEINGNPALKPDCINTKIFVDILNIVGFYLPPATTHKKSLHKALQKGICGNLTVKHCKSVFYESIYDPKYSKTSKKGMTMENMLIEDELNRSYATSFNRIYP